MSTGANCYFTEFEPGRWKYQLQQWPYGANEEYDSYGPFASYDAAQRHLQQNHANPGGWSVNTHPTGHVHEWAEGLTHVPAGYEVSIKVESLGPDADPQDVIRHIQHNVPTHHPAFRVRPTTRIETAIVCDACGAARDQEGATQP